MINGKKILIAGDIMLDEYTFGEVTRISPEAPVPVLREQAGREKYIPGGAANTAINVLAAGVGSVAVFSVCGVDKTAEKLLTLLEKNCVDIRFIYHDRKRSTTAKHRFIAQNYQQIMRLDSESCELLDSELLDEMFLKIREEINEYDLILISDYEKGFLTEETTQRLIRLANEHDIPVLVDVKGKNPRKYAGATLLKPNRDELKVLTNLSVSSMDDVVAASQHLCEITASKYVLTTLGAEGMLLTDNQQELLRVKSVAKEVYDVTGAGDTSIAYLTAELVKGNDILNAVKVANYAASVQVSKVGTSVVTPQEVCMAMSSGEQLYKEKELSLYREGGLDQLKSEKGRIVFTNGCFDILHAGHIDYLRKARLLGDCLVVAVNSDSSVKRLKGKKRPVNSLSDRLVLLSALEFVDYVVPFEEDTPEKLIRAVKPDVLVKGGDYRAENIVGADYVHSYGGEVTTIPFVEGKSTTEIINKIKG